MALAGTVRNSFAEASARVLPKLAALRVCASTAQRTTSGAGDRRGAPRRAGQTFVPDRPWDGHRDARGRTCASLSRDRTGVPQQARGGGAAAGCLPSVALVYNPVPDLPAGHPHRPPAGAAQPARYLAGLYDLGALGRRRRRQAAQVGLGQAQRWIGLTDGGGLEAFVRRNFPRAPVLILDCYHPAERRNDLAKRWHPRDPAQAQALGAQWCRALKAEGGRAVVALREGLAVPPRRPEVRARLAEALAYLRGNVHRRDYPSYQANGWRIGSGAVASACQTVVGQRPKRAGRRWGEDGTDALCPLRAQLRGRRARGAPSGGARSTSPRHGISDDPRAVYACSTNEQDARPGSRGVAE